MRIQSTLGIPVEADISMRSDIKRRQFVRWRVLEGFLGKWKEIILSAILIPSLILLVEALSRIKGLIRWILITYVESEFFYSNGTSNCVRFEKIPLHETLSASINRISAVI